MTTPAGWYDDGSGRQRWWDGQQWTEHFAPEVPSPEAETPTPETPSHDTVSPDSSAPETTAPDSPEVPTSAQVDAVIDDPDSALPGTAADAAVEPPAYTPPGAPTSYPETVTPPDAAPSPGYAAYPGSAPAAYPGSAPAAYPGSAPGAYPGPSGPGAGYGSPSPYGAPGMYPGAAVDTPKPMSIVGLVGLGLAAVGTILVCFPVTMIFGWILLVGGFVVSLVSLFLKGKKWPGITGIGVSVLGTIVGIIMFFVYLAVGLTQTAIDIAESAPTPSIGSDDGTTDDDFGSGTVQEGTLGEPVTIQQMDGTSEVTITAATWGTTNGSSFEAENGGYLTIELTWEGVEGTTHVNPLYFTVIDAEGNEGMYDIFSDATLESGELAAGEALQGSLSFDVAQSDSYTVIITDELLQDAAEVTIEASAR
ncbi:DUF2510 domain-containing protein [Microbacterium sp. 179-I 3D4 NHS]|uniref:DUF2510 domain-containing protein n=1 Tax=Microbacterium sp. 179-I 3D4 NHS TaxID=3142381 RepID=UPI0039A38060